MENYPRALFQRATLRFDYTINQGAVGEEKEIGGWIFNNFFWNTASLQYQSAMCKVFKVICILEDNKDT